MCARVEVGQHLDHVGADDLEAAAGAQQRQRLRRRRPAAPRACPCRARRPGRRSRCRSDRNALPAARSTAAATHAGAELGELVPGDEREAQLAGGIVVAGVVEAAAHAHQRRARRVDQALLDGAPHDRAVRVALAEVLVPGVDVSVEADQRRAGRAGCAAARSSASSTLWSPPRPIGTTPAACSGVQRSASMAVSERSRRRARRGVAEVDRGDAVEHRHALARVVEGAQRQRAVADGTRAEAGADPEASRRCRRAGRRPRRRPGESGRIGHQRQPQERSDAGEARRLERAGGTVPLHRAISFRSGPS